MRFPWSMRPEDLARADIPTLLSALSHKKPAMRLAAAISLAERKTRDPGIVEALTDVAGKDDDEDVRAAAGTALHLLRTASRARAHAA